MRDNVFDAHVHIMPRRLLNGETSETGATYDAFGRIHKPDGDVYAYMPCPVDGGAFSAEALIYMMDRYGIRRAMIMQSTFFDMTEDVAEAVARYPDRLSGAMTVRLDAGAPEAIAAWRRRGLTALKLQMRGLTEPQNDPDLRMDAPEMMEIYAQAGRQNVTVVVDPGPIGWAGNQPEALRRAVRRHAATRFVVCHLGMPDAAMQTDAALRDAWRQMTDLARCENVWFDVSAMPNLFAREEYPFPTALSLVAGFLRQYGEEKAIWGSDAPGALCDATYAQTLSMFERLRLGEAAMEKLFFRNAESAYL